MEVYEVNAKARFGAIWKFTKFTPMAVLLAGCGESAEQVRAENAVADAIPAGAYSNAVLEGPARELIGITLYLSQGSDSSTVDFQSCEGECFVVDDVPIRRGLNGIFFEVPSHMGEPILVAVERSFGGVKVNADWGNGLQTDSLKPVERDCAPTNRGSPTYCFASTSPRA